MKTSSIFSILVMSFVSCFSTHVYAQKDVAKTVSAVVSSDFSDKTPRYTLSDNYKKQRIITQVVYTETATIVYHSYTSENGYSSVYYLGVPSKQEHWVLQNKANPKEIFALTEIKNIRKNGILLKSSLINENTPSYEAQLGDVFTCEVYFPRLPKHVQVVDMLEGLSLGEETHRFHAFSLQLKSRPEPKIEVPIEILAKKPIDNTVVVTNLDTQISVYPNPAQDKIFIKFEKNQTFNIDILDVVGNIMIRNADTEIFVKNWQRGIYFVKLTNKQGTFTKKIVLE